MIRVFFLFLMICCSLKSYNQNLVLDLNPQYHICEGSTATLVAVANTGSGTMLPARYDWDHISGEDDGKTVDVSPKESTTYTVTITDFNSDILIQRHQVNIEKAIIDSLSKKETCPNIPQGSITIHASGKGLEYSIDNGSTYHKDSVFTKIPHGSYEIKVMNRYGCSASQLKDLKVFDKSMYDNCRKEIRKYSNQEYHFAKLKEDALYTHERRAIAKQATRWNRSHEYKDIHFKVVFHFLTDVDASKASSLVASQLDALNRDFGKPNLENR